MIGSDIHPALAQYIDPEITYGRLRGPDVVRSKADALEGGMNCVALAHLCLRDLFDYQLPSDLHFAEMYQDRTHFVGVNDTDQLQRGDLAWFGIEDSPISPDEFEPMYNENKELVNWAEFPVKHVSIYTGANSPTGDPLLLHARQKGNTNVIWPLPEFAKRNKQWEKFYGISRLAIANA